MRKIAIRQYSWETDTMQKAGNNTLFLIIGVLIIVLLGLIFIGSLQESSVDQLIDGAGPDSSSFVAENQADIQEVTPALEEEPVKKEEPKEPEVQNPDTSTSADTIPKVIPTAVKKVQDSNGEKFYFYTIKRGDTMFKIAAKFGNKPDDILTLNGLSDMNLQADKEIKVKIKAIHSVGDGEGLNAIAEKYGVSAKSIKITNGLNSEVLSSGVELIIPLK